MIIKLPFLSWDIKIEREFHTPSRASSSHNDIVTNRNYNKIFSIGSAKTGTTSLQKLLSDLSFTMGNQPTAEVLSRDWLANKNAERIIRYCHTADAFQDAPFGYPDLYKVLDQAFPSSKFILTVRNSPEEWYQSLVRFHSKKYSSDPSRPPDENDLRNATYRYKGYALESHIFLHDYPQTPLYDEKTYKSYYIKNNIEKRAYFERRPNDFIEINLAIKDDFRRLCEFLNIETKIDKFPWLNKS